MARRKRKEERLAPAQTRKQILRERKSAEERRTLLAVVVPIVLVAVALVVLGVAREGYFKPHRPVAKVDGQNITAGEYGARVEYERYQLLNNLQAFAQYAQSSDSSFLSTFGQQSRDGVASNTVDKLIDEALVRAEAAKRGITVSDDDVTAEIYSQLPTALSTPTEASEAVTSTDSITVSATATATITPTATLDDKGIAAATKDAQNEFERIITLGILETTGISERQYRGIVESQLYREKLQESLAAEVPITDTQVEAGWLRFEGAEVAERAGDAIAGGATWAEVVAEFGPPDEPPTAPLTATLGGGGVLTTTQSAPVTTTTGATLPITATDSSGLSVTAGLTPTTGVTATSGLTATGGVTETVAPTPTPPPYAAEAGERAWFTRQKLKDGTGLGDADVTKILAQERNTVSEPVTMGNGTYIVYVFDKDESRALADDELETRKAGALDEWLKTRRIQASVDRYPVEGLTPPEAAWFTDIFNTLVETAAPTLDVPPQIIAVTPTP